MSEKALFCHKADWKPTGFVCHSNPPQYEFRCETCGGTDIWSKEEAETWYAERNPDKIKIKQLEERLKKLETLL